MIGVTLSLGSVVVAAATAQFGLASGSASAGAAFAQDSAEVQLSLVYSSVQGSGPCPAYGGEQEGTTLTLALFDYGSSGFTPAGFVVNSSVYVGNFGSMDPGAMAAFTVTLDTCAHPSGQTIVAFDASGDEVQIET
jgi:hypothetical protein